MSMQSWSCVTASALAAAPELDMVVMVTSGLYARGRQGVGALDVLNNFVIPSVREGQ
jgi:hypothetical protein